MARIVYRYASGKHALGICDRCGLTYPLLALKEERVMRLPVGNKVCPSCWDPDHPQNMQNEEVIVDAEGLRDPRPDTDTGR